MEEEVALLFSGDTPALDAISFDATLTEQHTRDAEATEYPVEVGSAITDMVRVKADRLQMDAIISNTQPGVARASGYAEGIYEQLRLLQERATLVTALTTLRTYEHMVIESLSVTRTAKEAGAVHVSITLKQIRLVQNKTTIVVVNKGAGNGKKKGGTQTAKQKDDAAAEEYESQLFHYAGPQLKKGITNAALEGGI